MLTRPGEPHQIWLHSYQKFVSKCTETAHHNHRKGHKLLVNQACGVLYWIQSPNLNSFRSAFLLWLRGKCSTNQIQKTTGIGMQWAWLKVNQAHEVPWWVSPIFFPSPINLLLLVFVPLVGWLVGWLCLVGWFVWGCFICLFVCLLFSWWCGNYLTSQSPGNAKNSADKKQKLIRARDLHNE